MIIRPKSALGLKYVEITRGKSDEGYEEGDTIPVSASTPTPVEFDEFVNMFDEATRPAIQENLRGFGDAFAGRGVEHQHRARRAAGAAARHPAGRAQPVGPGHAARSASSTSSGTRRASSRPPPRRRPSCSANLDVTFTALDAVARPFIQDSITEGPPALDAAIRSFPLQRPFLRNTERLFRELQPGAQALQTAAPDLADTFEHGQRTLRRTPALQPPPRLAARGAAARSPTTRSRRAASSDLAETLEVLNPTLQNLAPVQTQLQLHHPWFRNVSSLLSEGDVHGTWQRFIIIATPQGPNNEGGPSSAPANGGTPTRDNYLHSNPYPNTGVARPAQGVRGRQRAVPRRPQGDRQRPRQAAGRATEGTQANGRRPPPPHTAGSPLTVGLIALAIVLVARVPRLHEGHPVHARLPRPRRLRVRQLPAANSPVRIAGVNVGKVKTVERRRARTRRS